MERRDREKGWREGIKRRDQEKRSREGMERRDREKGSRKSPSGIGFFFAIVAAKVIARRTDVEIGDLVGSIVPNDLSPVNFDAFVDGPCANDLEELLSGRQVQELVLWKSVVLFSSLGSFLQSLHHP